MLLTETRQNCWPSFCVALQANAACGAKRAVFLNAKRVEAVAKRPVRHGKRDGTSKKRFADYLENLPTW
jgi:hypothetical protein